MEDWKVLDINDMPSDILMFNKYTFYWEPNGEKNTFLINTNSGRMETMRQFIANADGSCKLFYRRNK